MSSPYDPLPHNLETRFLASDAVPATNVKVADANVNRIRLLVGFTGLIGQGFDQIPSGELHVYAFRNLKYITLCVLTEGRQWAAVRVEDVGDALTDAIFITGNPAEATYHLSEVVIIR